MPEKQADQSTSGEGSRVPVGEQSKVPNVLYHSLDI